MKNVIIDIGNFAIKYKADRTGKFSSKTHRKFESNIDAFQRIEFENKITFIGVGQLEKEFNKIKKDTLTEQILYAISKATNESDINLCLLLPISQMPQREELIQRFNDKVYEFSYNEVNKKIKINKCVVLPEGQCAYYSLINPSPYSLVIDLGSRTINWVAYEDGKVMKNGTEKLGVLDFYSRIKDLENAKGENYEIEDIETQIKRGRIVVSQDMYKDFLKDILNIIKPSVNIKNHDVTLVGGGASVVKSVLEQLNVNVSENPEFANVLGAEKICKAMM